MKKLLVVPLLLCLATAAFALDLSAGGGVTLGGFSQTAYFEPYFWLIFDVDSYKDVLTNMPFAVAVYFDATYGALTLGFRTNGSTHQKTTVIWGSNTNISEGDDENRSGFLTFSLLGRYPFTLGPITLFPLLGIEYDLNLYYRNTDGTNWKESMSDEQKADLNQFWFKGGVGADIVLYKGLYVRPQVLLGFKLHNQAERDRLVAAQGAPYDATTFRITDSVFEGGVQAGWRF